jgi:2,3-diketo-5-methylthio-1-phosphopentane phosphatase
VNFCRRLLTPSINRDHGIRTCGRSTGAQDQPQIHLFHRLRWQSVSLFYGYGSPSFILWDIIEGNTLGLVAGLTSRLAITLQDSNDYMTDNIGFGAELRKKGNEDVLHGRRDFRDSFQDMMDSISAPYNQCIELLLKNIQLDPGFKEFHAYARENNIPIVVLSGGMTPIIRGLLGHLLGEEAASELQIVSNDVKARPGKHINEERGWEIVFHDDSGFGHDKSLEIRKYSSLPQGQRPYLFYAGDGVSDLSAAKETDLMFVKAGRGESVYMTAGRSSPLRRIEADSAADLVVYCEKENVPHTTFTSFSDILSDVKNVVSGKVSLQETAGGRAGTV